jgi:hypothetical protein
VVVSENIVDHRALSKPMNFAKFKKTTDLDQSTRIAFLPCLRTITGGNKFDSNLLDAEGVPDGECKPVLTLPVKFLLL